MSITIESPRAKPTAPRRGRNWEKAGWLYMRASGVLLVILIFGHLFVNLYSGDGVKGLDFNFVADKYATPFWQVYDELLLVLALVHGSNGMRTVVNDYATSTRPLIFGLTMNRILKGALLVSTIALIILGTLVIFTFDPCPAGAPSDLIPAACSVVK
jgi:succinate dehydrogenase / fumarate reductase membrane anchor subunit